MARSSYAGAGNQHNLCKEIFADLLICIDLSITSDQFLSAMPSYWRAVLDQWVVAGSRAVAFGDPAQRTLDAAATRLRYGMVVAAAFRGHSHAHQSA
jgi:hypothetical protein